MALCIIICIKVLCWPFQKPRHMVKEVVDNNSFRNVHAAVLVIVSIMFTNRMTNFVPSLSTAPRRVAIEILYVSQN